MVADFFQNPWHVYQAVPSKLERQDPSYRVLLESMVAPRGYRQRVITFARNFPKKQREGRGSEFPTKSPAWNGGRPWERRNPRINPPPPLSKKAFIVPTFAGRF